jgi:hypothetical protein
MTMGFQQRGGKYRVVVTRPTGCPGRPAQYL